MIAFGPIVILLLCGLAAWMGVMAVLRVCFVPKGVEPGGSCGRCAYAYSGWQRCPECGGDVAEEGIATPRLMLKHRGSLRGALFSLTMLAAALVFLLTGITLGICQAAGWMQWVRQSEYTLDSRRDPTPQTGSSPTTVGVQIHWNVLGRAAGTSARGEILIVVNPARPFGGTSGTRPPTRGVAHASIDVPTGGFEVIDASGAVMRRGEKFKDEDAAFLLEIAGVGAERAILYNAGAEIAAIAAPDQAIASAAMRPAVMFTGAGALTEGTTSTWAVPSLPFFLFGMERSSAAMILSGVLSAALYIFALWLVLKRRRRLMRRVGTVTQPSSLAGV